MRKLLNKFGYGFKTYEDVIDHFKDKNSIKVDIGLDCNLTLKGDYKVVEFINDGDYTVAWIWNGVGHKFDYGFGVEIDSTKHLFDILNSLFK